MEQPAKKMKRSDGSSSSTGHSIEDKEDKQRVSWIMAIAAFLSTRSPDPKRKVGAVLVDGEGRLVGQGYNGMVKGASARDFPLEVDKNKPFQDKNNFVCHAEMNALFFSQTTDLEGSKLYVTTHPCNTCAINIAPTAIKEITVIDFQKDIGKSDVSQRMLKKKVKCWPDDDVWLTLDFEDCKFKDGCEDNKLDEMSVGKNSSFWVTGSNLTPLVFSWTNYFFSVCVLESMKNESFEKKGVSCDAKQGVCIVDKGNCIIACASNDLIKDSEEVAVPVRHAVITAILQARRQADGAALYALAYPCKDCAKAVVQSGIKSLTYLKKPVDPDEYLLAERIFRPKLEHREIAIRHESSSDGAKFYVRFFSP